MQKMLVLMVMILTMLIAGIAVAATFTDNKNGTVLDSATGLMWQQGEPGSLTWTDALSYCNGLSLGGNSDWRLPNITELESITDDGKYNPAIDTTYFPNVHASVYWSSTTDANDANYAWNVYFFLGSVHHNPKSFSYFVRCVRGGQ